MLGTPDDIRGDRCSSRSSPRSVGSPAWRPLPSVGVGPLPVPRPRPLTDSPQDQRVAVGSLASCALGWIRPRGPASPSPSHSRSSWPQALSSASWSTSCGPIPLSPPPTSGPHYGGGACDVLLDCGVPSDHSIGGHRHDRRGGFGRRGGRGPSIASRFALVVRRARPGGNAAIVNLIKVLVDRARPAVSVLTGFTGRSFPSGHSAGAAACYGTVALLLSLRWSSKNRAAAYGAAVAVAVAVACSRVLLGVHWVSDVVAGLAIGWSWLALCLIAFGGRRLRFGAPAQAAGLTGEA